MLSKNKFIIFTILILYITTTSVTGSGLVNAQPDEEYKGTDYCLQCHPSQGTQWSESGHADSFSNDNFQTEWTALGSDEECLPCHVTAYEEDTESYVAEEVQCEECHGPGDTMEIDSSPELCGECHSGLTPTYEEWQNSGPNHGAADCVTCHNQHTTGMKYETPDKTCGQCHESHTDQVEVSTHGVNDIGCVDCHMVIEEADFSTGTPGKTGHSFNPQENELDCTSCHERPLLKHDALGEGSSACLSCHGDIHELKLQLVNGDTYSNDEPVKLCAQCHNERYSDWSQGTHGAHDNPQAVCTECHDPHIPIINNISTLAPIPVREFSEPPSSVAKYAFVGVLLILGGSVWFLRRENDV